MQEFICRTRIVMGTGAINILSELKDQRLFVVADPFFSQNGWADRIGKLAGAYEIFDHITPDPSVELVAEGLARLQSFQPDAIAALGGGSAMDCAKAIACFSEKALPLIAIPTTSGSGSEVTDFSILTHNGVKHPLIDPKMCPETAILEEALLRQLPPSLIADCGFDIVAHALEGYVGQNATPITDALALEALHTVFGLLPASFEGDQEVRPALHIASTMAGLAFNQAGLGLCHALSHALGGQFHLPHGRLNAILLPAVISCNNTAKYATLSRRLGLGGSSDLIAIRSLKNALVRLRSRLKLPATLTEAGVDAATLAAKSEEIIAAALADPCCATNPIPVTEAMVHQVLLGVAGRG